VIRNLLAFIFVGFSVSAFAQEQLTRRAVDFGDIKIGTKTATTAFLRNRTWEDLMFERFLLSGDKAFKLATNCKLVLEAGYECYVKITAEPAKAGDFNATLEISYTTGESTIVDYHVRGVK
jgi:hypothetical protein